MPQATLPSASAVGLVAAGGAAGSVLRYLISLVSAPLSARFPWGTLMANAVGCLPAGILLFFVMHRDQPSPQLCLLLATGFLGGLTTFSAFSFETIHLLQRGQMGTAIVNTVANVALSLGAAFAGFAAARALA